MGMMWGSSVSYYRLYQIRQVGVEIYSVADLLAPGGVKQLIFRLGELLNILPGFSLRLYSGGCKAVGTLKNPRLKLKQLK